MEKKIIILFIIPIILFNNSIIAQLTYNEPLTLEQLEEGVLLEKGYNKLVWTKEIKEDVLIDIVLISIIDSIYYVYDFNEKSYWFNPKEKYAIYITDPFYKNRLSSILKQEHRYGFNMKNIAILKYKHILDESSRVRISVATIKDEYKVGEKIELTDPPSDSNDNRENEVFNSEGIRKIDYSPKQNGFIIELKDDPIIVQYFKLKKQAEKNKEKIEEKSVWNYITGKRAKVFLPEDKLIQYNKKLKNEHENIKEKINTRLKKLRRESSAFTGEIIKDVNNEEYVIAEYTLAFNGIGLDITDQEAEEIRKIKGVKSVYPNYEIHTSLNDAIPKIGADQVWKLDAYGNTCLESNNECLTGKGITIGILDSGIDYTHEDFGGCTQAEFLTGNCEKVVGGYNFINNNGDPLDDFGHGTFVAGIAAAKSKDRDNDGISCEFNEGELCGVVPDAKLFAYKILDKDGKGNTAEHTLPALEKTIDLNGNGIPCEDENDYLKIISISVVSRGDPEHPVSKSVDNIALCSIPVVAAGNSGPGGDTACRNGGDGRENSICTPGTSRRAITVGATNKDDRISSFSSRGPVEWVDNKGVVRSMNKPDVVAPGNFVCSTIPESLSQKYWLTSCIDNKHAAESGTSASAPIVAGAVALLKQKYPDIDSDGVKKILKESSFDLGKPINQQGFGRIDIAKSIGINPRPQSKIVNYDISSITGDLNIKIQRYYNNEWINEKEIINEKITFPAREILKLDNGEDSKGNKVYNGFNNIDVNLVNEGKYRLYASLNYKGKEEKSYWEFKVSGDNFECIDSDKGRVFNIKGIAIKGNEVVEDICLDKRTLKENYCDNNVLKSERHTCAILQECSDGICVSKELCNDNKDNDNDEKIDCDDSDCFDNKLCNPSPVQAIENTKSSSIICEINLSESKEIREIQSASVNGLYIGLLGADVKKNSVILTLNKEIINLNDNNKSVIKIVSDEKYIIDLISFTENSVVINVSSCR